MTSTWPELREGLASGTRRRYSRSGNQFRVWMSGRGVDLAPPIDPMYVAVFLIDEHERGLSGGSLSSHVAAINAYHDAAGLRKPGADPVVRGTLGPLTRSLRDRKVKQARALLPHHIVEIERTAKEPRGRESPADAEARGAGDIALVRVMFDAMLRTETVVALRWRHIIYADDGVSGVLLVPYGKTDQEGEGQHRYLSPRTMAALDAIRPKSPDPDGRLFIQPTADSVGKRIKRIASLTGLGDDFSGHSPRVGMAQTLVAAGISAAMVAQAGGWATLDMVLRYSSKIEPAWAAVARWYGSRLYTREWRFLPRNGGEGDDNG